MIDIKYLINNLNKATVIEVKHGGGLVVGVTVHVPTTDLDNIYTLYNSGKGFMLYWEDMDMVTKDVCFLKEDFKLLHKEVLKELMNRIGEDCEMSQL